MSAHRGSHDQRSCFVGAGAPTAASDRAHEAGGSKARDARAAATNSDPRNVYKVGLNTIDC